MTAYQFSALIGQTKTFDPARDSLVLPGSAADYTVRRETGAVTVFNAAGQHVTLSGLVLSKITLSTFTFADNSHIFAGDNTNDFAEDNLNQSDHGALDLAGSHSPYLDANNILFGMGGADTISVGNGNNIIYGGSSRSDSTDGGDRIEINGIGSVSGNNRIFAVAGNDTVLFTKPTGPGKTALVQAGSGNDNIILGAARGEDTIYGGRGNDTIDGNGGNGKLVVYGSNPNGDSADGADLITGNLGNATIHGNAGDDTLLFDDFEASATQFVYGGLGADSITGDVGGTGSEGVLHIYGNRGADTINITSHYHDVTVYGGSGGSDSSDGADLILAGTGDGDTNATILGNGGADTITSTAALALTETLNIYGGQGADTFNISGNRGRTSSLMLDGGKGNDILNLNDSTLTDDASVTIQSFEKTDVFNVTLSGGSAIDLVVTGLGASPLIHNTAGHGGSYTFEGYTGVFNTNNFVLGDGSSFQSNFGGTTSVSLSGTTNNDQLIAGGRGDSLAGSGGNDILTGGDGADSLNGGDGIDTITGEAGNDVIVAGDGGTASDGVGDSLIHGNEGSDSITGGANEDVLYGGLDNDTLVGGTGADTLSGGLGRDTFQFKVAELSAVADTNVDLITDAFSGSDILSFTDLTLADLRGLGTDLAHGDGSAAQTLGANVGLYIASNATVDFSEASIFTALSGIADDLAANDMLYVLISNGVDARLVRITEAANPTTLAAADDTLEYVARLQNVDTHDLDALTTGNFTNFI